MSSYTSTVGLVLSAAAAEKLKAKVAALPKEKRSLLKNVDDHRTKKGTHLFFWNCISEDEQRFLDNFLRSIAVAEYRICRVGDDLDDNEEGGMLEDPFDLRLRREVTIG